MLALTNSSSLFPLSGLGAAVSTGAVSTGAVSTGAVSRFYDAAPATYRRNLPAIVERVSQRLSPLGQLLSQPMHPSATDVYSSLVATYKGRVDESTKGPILTSLNGVFNAYLRDHKYADINDLKKMLDVSFSKDVGCKYMYFTSTPNSYGCDLRELIFNRDGTTTREGESLLATFQKIAAERPKMYHVLTDIDDTLYANQLKKTYIAGSDASWLQHTAYPGVKELHRQLHSLHNSTHYSTVISATPGAVKTKKLNSQELKDILGGTDFSFIQGIEGKLDIIRNSHSILWTALHRGNNPDGAFYRTLAETKYARFQQYARIFPERHYIWIGDNGQGDEVAGIRMLGQSDVTVTVCIHIVRQPAEGSMDPRIIYFNSYGELANKLFDKGILGPEQVASVIESAKAECASAIGTSDEQKAIHCHDIPSHNDMKRKSSRRTISRSRRRSRSRSRSKGGRRKRKTLKPRQRRYSMKHPNNLVNN